MLTAGLRGLVHKWEAVQVELHGSYSGQRFMQMYTYSRSTGFWRVLLVLLTTPMPSLALAALLDALPLEPIELGLAHSGTTWVRGVFMTIIESYSVISLLQHDVVNLELSSFWTLTISTATALVNNALALSITALLWYPLPFILFWMAWPWIALLVLFVWLAKGAFIRANPDVLTRLRRFSSVATSQLVTIMAYSIFKAVFLIVPTAWQPAFAMILPVFKLFQKNLLARMLKDRDDLKPQVIVFNVEISNALFITNSVQTGVSIDTSILLVATDFLQLLVSIYDLNLMLSDVRDFTNKLGVDSRQAVATAFTVMETHPDLAVKKVLDRAFQSKADLFRNRTRRSAVVTIEASVSASSSNNPAKIDWRKRSNQQKGATSTQSTVLDRGLTIGPPASSTQAARQPSVADSISITARLTMLERHLLLQKVLQILFLTEFVLLIEFMEVLVPVLHCSYLTIAYYLPNRAFYSELNQLDETQFWSMIGHVMAYALLEVFSLLLLVLAIHRTTYPFPLQHLSFVLEHDRPKVQPKIVIWVVLVLQAMLPQNGKT